MDIYQYSKEKAHKRANSQYYPLNPIDQEQTLIGLNIKYLRMKNGLSQRELMEILEIKSGMTISRWERGIYVPDASQTKILADFFKVSSDDLKTKNLFEQEKIK